MDRLLAIEGAKMTDDFRLNRDWERDVIGYPEPAIEVLDPRFHQYKLFPATIERLWTSARWTEGPVWFGDGRYLLFSDIPNDRILRWSEESGAVSTFRQPSHYANGNTRDRRGRLVTCEHDTRRVTRTNYDGTVDILMDQFEGKPLNSPNDVAVHADGSVWFTDPGYGILTNYEGHKAEFEIPTRVYRFDPESGAATVAIEELTRPNGLCFSPDHKLLYVVDTGVTHQPGHHRNITVYDVDGGRVGNGRVFCDTSPGMGDGVRCDVDGNLWVASGHAGLESNGVLIFAPDGTLIGRIRTPEPCSNLCFGGMKRTRLFITGGHSLYSVFVEAQGTPYY